MTLRFGVFDPPGRVGSRSFFLFRRRPGGVGGADLGRFFGHVRFRPLVAGRRRRRFVGAWATVVVAGSPCSL